MTVDPITLAVIRGSLEQIADEMDATLERMAFSPVISDGFDRASGIYERASGDVIVQGPRGLPNFIYVMSHTVRSVIERIPDPSPGDVYIVNDPYLGGTHLMDVKMVRPFYYKGELTAYLANSGHWPDIGGRVPGGFSTRATEIYQEGLQLPPVRLFNQGRLNKEVLQIILQNVRVSRERQGDIIAQVTSLEVGHERLTALLDRYGKATVLSAIDELNRRSEQMMSAHIASVPDGTYHFQEHIDSDGVENRPLVIDLSLKILGGKAIVDFSNSSPPCRGPLNSVRSTTMAGVFIAFKHVFPDVPINEGCFRPFEFVLPESTFLHAKHPRPVAGCAAEVCQRVIDVVLGALGQAMPEKAYAGPMGTVTNLSVGGDDPESGLYVFYSFIGGGYGGNFETDGLINGNPTLALARTQALEIFESRYPVRFRRYEIRDGSGGVGERRGGLGVVFEFELTRGTASASLLGDRGKFAPFGALGGGPAEKAVHTFTLGGETYVPEHISKDEGVHMEAGDSLCLRTPGGGGWGSPRNRKDEDVQEDVRRGYYDRTVAEEHYGVVIGEWIRRCLGPVRVQIPSSEQGKTRTHVMTA